MTTPDLRSLDALTRDYAAFQARKSGLATALGGGLVFVLFLVGLTPGVFGLHILDRPILEGFLVVPLLWLALKALVAHLLYRGLGTVKAAPDLAYERSLWFWRLGLALFLMVCLIVALYGFASGALRAGFPVSRGLSPNHPLAHPWAWLIWLPLLYLAPTPWAIRGIEEARAYAVLVGQCMLWLIPVFLFAFDAHAPVGHLPLAARVLSYLGLFVLLLGLAGWATLAMIRGWKEHRDYLALLRSLPREG